jgi:hypothetical protein
VKPVRIFGREPALWVGFITSALAVAGLLGLDGLSPGQAVAIAGGLNTVGAIVTAWQVRPIAPAIYTNAVAAGASVAAAYGLHASPELVLAVDAALLSGLSLLTRGHVSPTGAVQAVAPPAPPPVVEAPSAGQRAY